MAKKSDFHEKLLKEPIFGGFWAPFFFLQEIMQLDEHMHARAFFLVEWYVQMRCRGPQSQPIRNARAIRDLSSEKKG